MPSTAWNPRVPRRRLPKPCLNKQQMSHLRTTRTSIQLLAKPWSPPAMWHQRLVDMRIQSMAWWRIQQIMKQVCVYCVCVGKWRHTNFQANLTCWSLWATDMLLKLNTKYPPYYGKAPLKKEPKMKHPFRLTVHTCYLHVIAFPNSGHNWIMHKLVGLLTSPGRLTAHPLSLMTQEIKCKHTHPKGWIVSEYLLPKLRNSLTKTFP